MKLKPTKFASGVSLIEVMIAMVLISVACLTLIGTLAKFNASISLSCDSTIATHLAKEKLEAIKSESFYSILVTSSTILDTNYEPTMPYDGYSYPPEEITAKNITFSRRVFVEKVDAPTDEIRNMGYPHPDTGLKRINVHVCWKRFDNYKKVTVSDLITNPDRVPLNNKILGVVTDSVTGDLIGGALIQARRNPGWGGWSDINGNYSFNACDDTMVLRCSKRGYELYTSPNFAITLGNNIHDIDMTPIDTTIIEGYALFLPGLVISKVCAQWGPSLDQEFVELYNCSTCTVSMNGIKLKFSDYDNNLTEVEMRRINNSLPPFSYYLIYGSTSNSITTLPDGTTADAVYVTTQAAIPENYAHGITIQDACGMAIDSLAWGNSLHNPPAFHSPPSVCAMGTGFYTPSGKLHKTDSLARKATYNSTDSNMMKFGSHEINANGWNTYNNNSDFVYLLNDQNPRNTSVSYLTPSGTVLGNAIISINDGFSANTRAGNDGFFRIEAIAGTWEIFCSSDTLASSRTIVVPEIATADYELIVAWGTSTVGYVYGTVRKYSSDPFPGILCQADPGGTQCISDSNGLYWFALPGNESYYITGNPNYNDPNWNTATTSDAIYVTAGQVTGPHDLSIWMDGWISGRVASGGSPVPNVVVVAKGQFSNGNTAVTDGNGDYVITGLRLVGNPYEVTISLLDDQVSSPERYTVSVTQGGNRTGKDFILSGSYAEISGHVKLSGEPIKSGIIIMASTAAIDPDSPPIMDSSVLNGTTCYFGTVSSVEGEYSLSVPGGETYQMTAWYFDGSTTLPKQRTETVPASGRVSGRDFLWP